MIGLRRDGFFFGLRPALLRGAAFFASCALFFMPRMLTPATTMSACRACSCSCRRRPTGRPTSWPRRASSASTSRSPRRSRARWSGSTRRGCSRSTSATSRRARDGVGRFARERIRSTRSWAWTRTTAVAAAAIAGAPRPAAQPGRGRRGGAATRRVMRRAARGGGRARSPAPAVPRSDEDPRRRGAGRDVSRASSSPRFSRRAAA